jgi:dodecin
MSDEVYKTVQLIGSSKTSSDDAVRGAIARARETIRNIRWFRVTDTRGHVEDGQIAHWQVSIELGFTLERGESKRA